MSQAQDEIDLYLHNAVVSNDTSRVAIAIVDSANVHRRDDKAMTALHHAAIHAGKEIVELLADEDAEVDAVDHAGMTPLHHAIAARNFEAADALLAAKADKNARFDVTHMTPVYFAFFQDMNDGTSDRLEYILSKKPALEITFECHANGKVKTYLSLLEIARDFGGNDRLLELVAEAFPAQTGAERLLQTIYKKNRNFKLS